MPPVITHAIQRHGDPLPTFDPRASMNGEAEIELAADAPAVHPNQPSPEQREPQAAETPEPATEQPAAEAPAAEEPAAEAPTTEAPASEPPAAEAPATEAPSSEPSTPQMAEPAEPAPDVLPRLSSPPFDAPDAADRDAINQCRTEEAAAGRSADACIGEVADACAEGVADDASATNACVERETRVWAEKLDQSLGLLKARLSEESAQDLADVQESWVDFRQRNCAFYSSFYEGPLTLAQAGYCIMRETARRSIEIDSLLTQAEQR